MDLNKYEYVLASGSPRRKQLLEMIGLNFEVKIPEIEEVVKKGEAPFDFVRRVSVEKGLNIKKEYDIKRKVIISSDTIVLIDNKIIGKPKTRDNAREMLRLLSGNVHKVITGLSLIYNNKKKYNYSVTDVFFKDLKDSEIEYYLDNEDYMDKAGAYAIQGLASVFIEKINGCFFNVMGFPLNLFYEMLKKI